MDCDQAREELSARLDGEESLLPSGDLDAHLASCPACAGWCSDVAALHRTLRLRPAEAVPDLSAAIVAAALPGEPSGRRAPAAEPVSASRWALFVIAATQLVLALPSLLLGELDGGGVHVARELAAFDVALAVGLLVAAWQPPRAWGLLPASAALGLVMGGTAVVGIVDGSTSALGEVHHLLYLAGVALLWRVARTARPSGGGRLSWPRLA